MTADIAEQAVRIQERAELDRLLDDFAYVFRFYRGLFEGDELSETTRARMLDYTWSTLVQAKLLEPNKPTDQKVIVMEHDHE